MKNGNNSRATRRLLFLPFVGGLLFALPHVAFSQAAPDFSLSDDLLRGALQDHRPGDVYVDRRYSDGRRAVQAVNRSNVSRIVAANSSGAPVAVGTFADVAADVSRSRWHSFLNYARYTLGRIVPFLTAVEAMFSADPLNVGGMPVCSTVTVSCNSGGSWADRSHHQYEHCLVNYDETIISFRIRDGSSSMPPGSTVISQTGGHRYLTDYSSAFPGSCTVSSSSTLYSLPRSTCQDGAANCIAHADASNDPLPSVDPMLPQTPLSHWSGTDGIPLATSSPYVLPAPNYAPDITVYPDIFEPLPASVPAPSPDAPPIRISEPRFLPGLVTGTTTGTTTTTHPDNTTTTSQTSTQSQFEFQFPNQMDVNVLNWPAALGGSSPSEPLPPPAPIDGVIPELVIDLPALDLPGTQTGSCPPPVSIDIGSYGSVELSYEPVCTAATYIRPLVLISAAISALFIVFGAGIAGRGD